MPVIVEFKECAACAVEVGSPRLCASCLHNRTVIHEFQAYIRDEQRAKEGQKKGSGNSKQFRIDRIRVHAVAIDSEDSPGMRKAAERAGHEYDEEAWQDLVVTLEDEAGNKFEAARVTVRRDGCESSWTSVAKLTCARSWGTEEDDDSVSCPLCLHRGHGAGACKSKF